MITAYAIVRVIPVAAIALVLFGCAASEPPQLKQRTDIGIGGFTGAVRPIDRPVLVRLGAVQSFSGKIEIAYRTPDGSIDESSASYSGTQLESDGKYLKTIQIDDIEQNGEVFKRDKPLIKMQSWFDRNGKPIGIAGVSFPAIKVGTADLSAKKAEEIRRGLLDGFAKTPPFKSYSQGEVMFSPDDFKDLFSVPSLQLSLLKNTVWVRAAGLTMIMGRPAIIGRVSGVIEAAGSKLELETAFSGHLVLDVRTGLIMSMLIRADRTIKPYGGKTWKSPAVGSWKNIDVKFLSAPRI